MAASVQVWDRVGITVVTRPASSQVWDRVVITVVAVPASAQVVDYVDYTHSQKVDAFVGVFDEVLVVEQSYYAAAGVFDEVTTANPAKRHVWDGSQWIRMPEYIWNGSSWQQIV